MGMIALIRDGGERGDTHTQTLTRGSNTSQEDEIQRHTVKRKNLRLYQRALKSSKKMKSVFTLRPSTLPDQGLYKSNTRHQ